MFTPPKRLEAGVFVPPPAPARQSQGSVLMISYLFPPVGGGGVQRALKMARYLPTLGWRPLVICVDGLPPGMPRDQVLLDELPSEVVIDRVPPPRFIRALSARARQSTSPDPGDTPRRGSRVKARARSILAAARDHVMSPDEQRPWVRAATGAARDLIESHRPDVLFSTSGPVSNHLVAERLQRSTGLPWVADFRDPWINNMHWRHLPAGRRRRERRMEARMMGRVSCATAVTRAFCEDLADRHPGLPAALIYNGFDPDDYRDLTPSAISRDGERTLVYAGALYPRRSPAIFLHAVRALIDSGELRRGDLRLLFAGIFDYPGHSANRRLVADLDLEDVVYDVGSLSHRRVLALMASADGLLLIGDDDPAAGAYIPGKIFEYLALEKPIVGCQAPGEARDILEMSGRAFLCDPGDAEGARAVLRAFLARGHEEIDFAKDAPWLQPFRRDYQAAQLAELFNVLCSGED